MSCNDVRSKLDAYVDGELTLAETGTMRSHIERCPACAAEIAALRAVKDAAASLPREFEPGDDLWPEIERAISVEGNRAMAGSSRFAWLAPPAWTWPAALWRAGVLASVAIIIALGAREWRLRAGTGSPEHVWQVTTLTGAPVVGSRDVTAPTILPQGEWLRTDAHSRARLTVADVGRIDVGPASSLRVVDARDQEHRIELAQGSMSAFIWAPPRLFFVETPAGVAEDLGCQYDLVIDRRGDGTLDVMLGFVSFERNGREVIVPGDFRCELRAGVGPGTPHAATAPSALREALARFDFRGAHDADLAEVLEAATDGDAVTLWHLIPGADEGNRERVVDRLTAIVALPDGITRDAVLALDRPALEAWWTAIQPGWDLWN